MINQDVERWNEDDQRWGRVQTNCKRCNWKIKPNIFKMCNPCRNFSKFIASSAILFVTKTPLRGRKDPLKFASLPTCGFVAQLVERPTSIWEARVQAPSKPEIFSRFFFCNFFNCSLPARINSLLITRRSNMNYFIYYLRLESVSTGYTWRR